MCYDATNAAKRDDHCGTTLELLGTAYLGEYLFVEVSLSD